MFKKDPLQIIVFQTYGTKNHMYLRGRALEDENIDLEQHGIFKLLINAWKRFESDEIANIELKVRLSDNHVYYTKTDKSGYFKLEKGVENISSLANAEGWVKLEFSYLEAQITRTIVSNNKFPGEMLLPSSQASFGVISDIDDTVLHTGLTSILKWRVLINTLLTSAGKRLPLEGAPEFYHKLHRGKTGEEANPIFYVSHSPWNLYHYLELFLNKNNFPKGPIILRSFPRPFSKKRKGEKPQKQKEILNILKTYPKLSFILIGDIGEHDPLIYKEIAEEFPNRILAIYLRNVAHRKKKAQVLKLYKEFKEAKLLLVESSEQAINHAKKHGFIKS